MMYMAIKYEVKNLLWRDSQTGFYWFQGFPADSSDEDPEVWARKQKYWESFMTQVKEAWHAFLGYFNNCCNEFCRQDPDFAPFLEKIIKFEDWSFHDEVLFKKYTATEFRVAQILQDANNYVHRFLTTFYSLYQKVPKGGEGIFFKILPEEDGQDIVKELCRIVWNPDFVENKFLLVHLSNIIVPRIPKDRNGKPVFPVPDYKAVLKDTPFYDLVETQTAFDIPLDARMAHIDICAGSGHGKTWLLQSFITDILHQGHGFLVMDSQGALIPKILELKPLLQKEVIYINPEDREYIPGITFFGVNLEGVEDKDKAYNTLISFYESIFNDLMGSGLTEKQGFMFGYVSQLLLTIPKATIFTFIDVLTNGDKYRRYMQGLPSTARYFFENHFFQKTYDHTKQEIARKLLGLIKTSTVDRILNNTEQRIDFYKAMNEGAIILINTSKDYLQATLSSFFGKFLLGMIYTNVVKRDPDGRDPPFFFFIDEAQEYFLKSMGDMFSQFRKFNVGLCIAHQNLEQLKKKGIDADVRASTAVKIVGSPDKEDAHVFAAEMRVTVDFLNQCRKYKNEGYSEWACFVRHEMDKAVKITAPWFVMDKVPKMTKDEQQAMVERNRQKYCVKIDRAKPADGGDDGGTPKDPTDPPAQPGSGQTLDIGGRDDSIWD